MQFDHISGTGGVMKSIHVLGDQPEFTEPRLPERQRLMRGIRLQGLQHPTSIIEPFPNRSQIALQHSRGGNDVEWHAFPNRRAAAAAKRRHAGLR